MNIKRQLSILLAVLMVISMANITLADDKISIQETQTENFWDDNIKLMYYSTTDVAYPVEGGNVYFNKNTGAITAGDKSITSAVIPDTIEGVKVTSIGYDSLGGCNLLTSISIPDSVTSLETYAFANCSSLTSIDMSKNLTNIGYSTFWNCTSLTSLNIPDSVASIDTDAFKGCSSLTSINIPKGITSIKDRTFNGCSSLTSVYIPGNVTSIGENAFSYCNSLTDVDISEGVTSIGSSAFRNCGSLKNVSVPNSLTYIGSDAFLSCNLLASIYIPEGVTSISSKAVRECSSLKNIYIPGSVNSVGYMTFYGCKGLTDVYYNGSEEQWNLIKFDWVNENLLNANIHYNCTAVSGENGVIYINKENREIVDSDESIKSVKIPKEVNGVEIKSISNDAFKNCKDLESITIPETVTNIDKNAFADCTSLKEVYCIKNSYTDNKTLYPENTEIKYTETYIYGDADGDGSLVASDAAAVLQKVLKSTYKLPIEDLTPDYGKYLDVDGSGKLDAADAAMILQKVLKSTYKFSIEN